MAESRHGGDVAALVRRARPHVLLLDLFIEPAFDALATVRELEVLRLAKRGLPNPQIAQALHISPGTVRNHLSSVYRKLGVHSRHGALQIADEHHLI